jgi:amino-acid N-acetyltransferase
LFGLRPACDEDLASVRVLLERAGLPTGDLPSANPRFVVAWEGSRIVGAGALEIFGTAALLRSVVVTEELRGSGLGRSIVRELERIGRDDGVRELVLLTQTARHFFEHQGYRVIDRGDVPEAARGSEEFRSLCPASATCMAKTLGD